MSFSLTILGSSSATPTRTRYPSAQVINIRERYFLTDCGEGTQMQMRRYGIPFRKVRHILISHLHGDHYLGLPGLIFTLHIFGRTEPLCIYANNALEEIIEKLLRASDTRLNFELQFFPLKPETEQVLFEDETIKIQSFPLVHRVPTHGFHYTEKISGRKLRPEVIQKLKIPNQFLNGIKKGSDYTDTSGKLIPNADLTLDPPLPRTYTYCSDTAFSPELVRYFKDTDLLYHESTFANDKKTNAAEKFHATAEQAAITAREANAGTLLLGHFSARYNDPALLEAEARQIFPRSYAVYEGMKIHLNNKHEIEITDQPEKISE